MLDIHLDIESEEHAIACALVDPVALPELISRLRARDFSPANAPIWGAIRALFASGQEVNQLSVAVELGEELARIGGQTYLAECIRQLPTSINAGWYADEILRQARARDIVSTAAKIQTLALDKPWREAIDQGIEMLLALAVDSMSINETQTAAEVFPALFDEISAHMEDPKRLQGIATGWRQFDLYLSGLCRKRVHLYGAETSLGKSLFAHDLIRRVAGNGAKVLIFSTEMSNQEVARRIAYQMAGIDPFAKIASGYTTGDREQMWQALERFRELPIVFCERGDLSFAWLRSECRRVKAKLGGLDIVVIDHLDMVSADGGNRTSQLETITGGIKALATREDVAVIEVSHLSRVTEFNKASKTNRFRNSESKGQDANIAWFLTPVDAEGNDMTPDEARSELSRADKLNVRLEITKQRHGKVGMVPMVLSWQQGGRYFEVQR